MLGRVILAVVLVGCSGADKPITREPEPAAAPDPTPADPPDAPPAAPSVQHKPEVFPPAWKKVGVGQTISFSVAALDADLDETRVDVTQLPPTARFDALTQTVTWTPAKAEAGTAATFVLRIQQADEPGGAWTRTETVSFDIAVDAKRQPPPVPVAQNLTVETLLTIRERERLTQVNLDWPIDKMLAHGAELYRATLPPEIQAKLPAVDRAAQYTAFLAGLARTHANPRLDPASPSFDRLAFGSPEDWAIVAVRPRFDKQWNELRIVYQAIGAPEPVFAMIRLRPTWDVPTLPAEARTINNTVFAELVAKHLLGKDLGPNKAFASNKRAHAKAVAALVKAIAGYRPTAAKGEAASAPAPWQRAAFVALWTGARMGGGSARDADGGYRSGDGWAWSVMKPLVGADGASQAYVEIGIPGFWTQAVPSAAGTAWEPACPPKFDPDHPKHTPGFEVLCRKPLGLVDLPAEASGAIASSKRDAVNVAVIHKRTDAVMLLALDDGRRDAGEDSGMSCAQCHTRRFGVRDYTDAATADPSAGAPRVGNAEIPTVAFQLVPSATSPQWEAYTLAFMKDQECRGKANLEAALGVPTALTCPLVPAP
jgi:hypothetical protein